MLRDNSLHVLVSCQSYELPQAGYVGQFYYRASYVLGVIVCLSVRLFVTSRSCTNMGKPRIPITTPYDSSGTLVFRRQKFRRNSNQIIPTGAPNRGGVSSHRRFSTNISLYLTNGARQGHTFYERLIKAHNYALYRMAIFSMTLGDL